MAYELTAAAAPTANPYVIAAAAVIDTARALATQTNATSGSKITQRSLSGEDFAGIINRIVSQDSGLAAGNFGDVFTKQLARRAVGTYDTVTAPTVETLQQTSKTKRSFICTELLRQGKIHPLIYAAGEESFNTLPKFTKLGYWSFAEKLSKRMSYSETLSSWMAYIFRSRYLYILGRKFNLIGALTVYIGQPVCNLLGRIKYG